jgi:Protein of unknown function (DUF2877)
MVQRTVIARSIGARASGVLRSSAAGHVLASFPRVCDLLTDDGAVVALGSIGVERGPLTVLLDPMPAGVPWADLPVGSPFRASQGQLLLQSRDHSAVRIDLSQAVVWEARPGWDALKSRRQEIRSSARILDAPLALTRRPDAALRWTAALGHATGAVRAAYAGRDRQELMAAARSLCGLGEGLTPEGDDWLVGWLLALHLADPPESGAWGIEALGAHVLAAAANRSTLLSRALLACAVAGEASESWHNLLHRMAQCPADARQIEQAMQPILAQGATSGAAMLEGFLAGLGDAIEAHLDTRGNGTH